MSDEEVYRIIDPEHVGRLPVEIFALEQVGVFEGRKCPAHSAETSPQPDCSNGCNLGTEGKTKHVIALTHSKANVDHGVELIQGYGSPDHKYRVFYGRIVWESEGDVVPEAAPVQSLFDPGPAIIKGVRMVGDLPAKGQPGRKIKTPKKKTVKHGED